MNKKKINYFRLALANLLIFLTLSLILMITPNETTINLIIVGIYFIGAMLFNGIVLEK